MTQIQDSMSYSSSSSSSRSGLEDWYLRGGQQSTNYYQNQLGKLPTSGYQGERVAGLSPLQQAGIAQGQGYLSESSPLYGQGVDYMQQAAQQLAGAGQWSQAGMEQHLNPYTTGALNTMAGLSNRNLMENVLPNVNSTFTGAGQFGSTRNADFTNRAIRDNQEAIANASAQMLNQAYGQAADNYYKWGTLGAQTGQQMGALGQMMGQYGITGLNTGMNLGTIDQRQQQQLLDAQKAAWTENYTFPMDLYNQLAGAYNTSVGRLSPTSTSSSSSTSYSSSSGLSI